MHGLLLLLWLSLPTINPVQTPKLIEHIVPDPAGQALRTALHDSLVQIFLVAGIRNAAQGALESKGLSPQDVSEYLNNLSTGKFKISSVQKIHGASWVCLAADTSDIHACINIDLQGKKILIQVP